MTGRYEPFEVDGIQYDRLAATNVVQHAIAVIDNHDCAHDPCRFDLRAGDLDAHAKEAGVPGTAFADAYRWYPWDRIYTGGPS